MKLRKRLQGMLVLCLILAATLVLPVLAAGEDAAAVSRFYNTAWAFLPPVVAIVLAVLLLVLFAFVFMLLFFNPLTR